MLITFLRAGHSWLDVETYSDSPYSWIRVNNSYQYSDKRDEGVEAGVDHSWKEMHF